MRNDNPEKYLQFIRSVSPDTDPESVLLFGKLARTSRQLMHAVERHLETVGLSWAKFRLLLDLEQNAMDGGAGMLPSELSERQGLSRNTISALIAGLEQEGLISRALHRTDRRKFVIQLAPEGRRLLRSKLDSEFIFVTQCFAALTPAERETLGSLLTRVNASVQENKRSPNV